MIAVRSYTDTDTGRCIVALDVDGRLYPITHTQAFSLARSLLVAFGVIRA